MVFVSTCFCWSLFLLPSIMRFEYGPLFHRQLAAIGRQHQPVSDVCLLAEKPTFYVFADGGWQSRGCRPGLYSGFCSPYCERDGIDPIEVQQLIISRSKVRFLPRSPTFPTRFSCRWNVVENRRRDSYAGSSASKTVGAPTVTREDMLDAFHHYPRTDNGPEQLKFVHAESLTGRGCGADRTMIFDQQEISLASDSRFRHVAFARANLS